MTYHISLSAKAGSQLANLPADLRTGVAVALERLAVSPTTLSVPIASPPFAPVGQLYHFSLPGDPGRAWFFTVVFRYSQDETRLHLISITHRDVREGDPY